MRTDIPPLPTTPARAVSSTTEAAPAVAPASTFSAGSALSRKIKKVLAIRADSASCRDAMSKVSDFFDENTVHSRRHLRADVEAQTYRLHEKFVEDFSAVEETLTHLDSLVTDLEQALTTATKQLDESKSKTKGVLQTASALRTQRASALEKQQILAAFLEKFQIPDHQLQIVKSSDFPINSEFFDAVAKVEEIRHNARVMLDLMSHQGAPTAGVDILHETSDILETAFERLFVWVQKQCRTATNHNSWMRDAKGTFLRSLELLRDRPVYFNHCITNVARVRRQLLVQAFHNALTQGEPLQGIRPIEAHAYDPLRYCGDMLAWIHENAARERDQLAPCLDHRPEDKVVDGLQLRTLEDILDMVIEGLVHPFKTRVESVLRVRNDQSSAILSFYRTSQLFNHFALSLTQILEAPETITKAQSYLSDRQQIASSRFSTSGGSNEPKSGFVSGFVTLLRDLGQRTFQTFLDMCDTQAQKLRERETATYSSTLGLIDLSTPSFVTETVKMLEEVLEIYQGSLTTETANEREDNFLPILSAAYDPLLNHCRQIASSLDPLDRSVFAINCISAMRQPLTKYAFTSQRLGMYVSLLDDDVTSLISSQSQNALRELGLTDLMEEVRNHRTKPVDRARLAEVLKAFYTSLFTLKTLALPQIDRISAHGIRSEVRRGVSGVIAKAYADLYTLLQVDKELLALATHTPEQVKVLLE